MSFFLVALSSSTLLAQSTIADLNALSISNGILSLSFDGSTLTYTSSVVNTTISITVTPTVAESHATVQTQVNSAAFTTVTRALIYI